MKYWEIGYPGAKKEIGPLPCIVHKNQNELMT